MAIFPPTIHSPRTAITTPITSTLSHSLHLATLCHGLLRSTTFFLLIRLYLFTSVLVHTTFLLLLRNVAHALRIFAINTLYALKHSTINVLHESKFLAGGIAKEARKRTEKARKKIFFEFMVWILNPNAVALFVFWPGWIVVAGVWFGARLWG